MSAERLTCQDPGQFPGSIPHLDDLSEELLRHGVGPLGLELAHRGHLDVGHVAVVERRCRDLRLVDRLAAICAT